MAERIRMGLIAQNISHAEDLDRGDGTPYRRQMAVFESVLEGHLAGGVDVKEIVDDETTPFVKQLRKGHPLADENGMVTMPNVNTTYEMIDLMTAARAYEANLQAVQVAVKMAEQALELAR